MPKFKDLPEDLADIVCDFAFQTTYCDVFHSLKTYQRILCFKVPKALIHNRLFSPKYLRFVENPLYVFEPISCFDGYRDLFKWNEVYCHLWQLDFRRSIVKLQGTRGRWHLRLTLSWSAILDIVIFFRTLHSLGTPIYKPTVVGAGMFRWF